MDGYPKCSGAVVPGVRSRLVKGLAYVNAPISLIGSEHPSQSPSPVCIRVVFMYAVHSEFENYQVAGSVSGTRPTESSRL